MRCRQLIAPGGLSGGYLGRGMRASAPDANERCTVEIHSVRVVQWTLVSNEAPSRYFANPFLRRVAFACQVQV